MPCTLASVPPWKGVSGAVPSTTGPFRTIGRKEKRRTVLVWDAIAKLEGSVIHRADGTIKERTGEGCHHRT
ncbi:MAG TPA: hypothetical protein PLN56_08770 [Methanoregulaceae archaeon]|nr:MAG: hypothetical protein IPI71_02020 [Methanolinea sp.]HPD11075.1 hypothetical protein [Methanoregulaceae archaeon]